MKLQSRMPKGAKKSILAVVDIGSNSVRLKVAHVHGRHIDSIHEARERTRLGANLATTQKLDEESMIASVEAIEGFVRKAKKLHAQEIRVLATAAVREAKNQDVFVRMLKKKGISLQVIDAVHEARLGFLSAASAFNLSRGVAAVFDIGGGSAQIVIAKDGVLCKSVSMPLGAVRLMKQFGGPDAVARQQFARALKFVDHTISVSMAGWDLAPDVVIGTGGTMSSLLHVAALRRLEAHLPSHRDRPVSRERDIQPILADMRRLSVKDRGLYLGAQADRADIIVTGLLVADRILAWMDAEIVNVHDGGIRDGALLLMASRGGLDETPEHLAQEVDLLRRRSGDDMPHTQHVAKLSCQILDQMRPDDPSRHLLWVAAKLHDIGQMINYEQHHRLSAEMIRAAALPGLSQREVDIVSCVARYHRKAMPERTHYHYQALRASDKKIVNRLAAIVRVADGLDRTHLQIVRNVKVSRSKGKWKLVCRCSEKIGRCKTAAESKADLWKRVFGPISIVADD